MKVFVIFLVLIMISLTFFIPTSFAQSYVCQEHDSEITVISSKEVFYPNENMTLSVIGQPNKTTELIIENPKNTVFSETKTSTTDNTTFAYTIEANPMKGTWKIIANQDANVDILFLGVYDKPQRVLTVHATALSHSKFHTATFTIAGNPQQPLNLDVTDSMKQTVFHDKLILNSNGMCVYSLALSDFSTGVYDLEISDNTVSDSTTFSVGLQPYDPALEAVSKFTKHDASDLTKPTTPLKQVELGVSLDKIKCKSNLVLIQKYDGTPACVTESTKQKLIERGWTKPVSEWSSYVPIESEVGKIGSYGIQEENKTFELRYHIHGGDITEITSDTNGAVLKIMLNPFRDGFLKITVPRDLLDSRIGGEEDDFFVLLDRIQTTFTEESDDHERELLIPFSNDTKMVEIIGSNPDF